MATCEHCQELLFDYVYGLLEGSELQEVSAHLDACSGCKSALDQALAHQNLLARAALAVTEVPVFSLPKEPTPSSASESTATIRAADTMPAAAAAPDATEEPARPAWRRPWVAWATAAAILIAVSTGISLYRIKIDSLSMELAARKQQHKQVDQELVELPAKYAALRNATQREVRAAAAPHLHVAGPTQLQRGASGNIHITTRHVEGDLAPAKLNVKLVEAGTQKVVQQSRLASAGEARLQLDPAGIKANSKLELIVEAETDTGLARVSETIAVPAASHVARIDISKMAYQIHDVLFFRVLVLDRTTLTPPVDPVLVNLKLLNPKAEVVREMQVPTGPGGIIAGEWGIEEQFLAGHYQLQVSAAAGAPALQQTAQQLEVVRELRVPEIQFDQQRYLPGEVATGSIPPAPAAPGAAGPAPGGFPVPSLAVGKVGNETVPVTIQPEFPRALRSATGAAGMGGGGVGAIAKAKKEEPKKTDGAKDVMARAGEASVARRFSAPLPKNLPEGASNVKFTIQMPNGKKNEEYNGVVALQPTDLAVDFFPEGGDLIAGVVNRVFYRVRTKTGEAVTGDGRVILLSSKNEVVDSPYQYGLGYFDFPPHARESYTVRITSPVKTSEMQQPFAKLGIRTSGVVLHVAEAVGKQGEPVQITLRNQGPERKLMLAVTCRDQIVDQRWVDIKTGAQDLSLQTTPRAHGMVRVTAYEVERGSLEPIAERLVYRTPTGRLDLGLALSTRQYRPGQHVAGSISARDEKGLAADAWVLASAVDERLQARPRSLSAHFMLLNEIRAGADLDDARLVLHDSPESAQLLERFLGTHGWRRFVRTDVAAQSGAPQTRGIFSRENASLNMLQKQYEEKLSTALTPIRQTEAREQIELEDQRERAAEGMRLAALDLIDFETQVQYSIRLALGGMLAVLLGISLVLMAVGAYRIVRAHKVATPAFGGAFACLAICMVTILLGNALGKVTVANMTLPGNSSLAAVRDAVDRRHPMTKPAEPMPAGDFAVADGKPRLAADAEERSKGGTGEKHDSVALHDRLAKTLADRRETEQGAQQKRGTANPMMLQRFQNAVPSRGGVAPQPSPPTVAPAKEASKTETLLEKQRDEAKASRNREYAHQHAPNLASDTLLWSPNLHLIKGAAEVHFDIASGQATYRLLLLGHTADGRFGFHEMRLDVPAVDR